MIKTKENQSNGLTNGLILINKIIYDPLKWTIENFQSETESQSYDACTFLLENKFIMYRKAKVTPTKTGQFVTLWKRKVGESIEPYEETDPLDIVVIDVSSASYYGHFIFPKSILIQQGIISTIGKEGKRAIRVYPPWDKPTNSQAKKTQHWQSDYFVIMDLSTPINLKKVKKIYSL